MTIFDRKYGITTLFIVLVLQSVLVAAFAFGYWRLADQNSRQNDDIQATLDRGRQIISCLTDYTTSLQTALNGRDDAATTTRSSTHDWVESVKKLVAQQQVNGAQTFFQITDVYLAALERAARVASVNPYPKIKPCLDAIDGND